MEVAQELRGPELRLRAMGQLRRKYGIPEVVTALLPTMHLTQGPQHLPRCAQSLEQGRLRLHGKLEVVMALVPTLPRYTQSLGPGHLGLQQNTQAPNYSGQGLAQVQSCPRNWGGLAEFQMLAHVHDLGWHSAHGAEGNAQVPRLQRRAAGLGVRVSQMCNKVISKEQAPFKCCP